MIERVAVFGASGMLGGAVTDELRVRGFSVLRFPHHMCDIADPVAVEHAFETGLKFEAVINCAGKRPGADSVAMVRANALGPWVLAAAAFRHKVQVVHVSTDCVFDGKLSSYPSSAQVSPVDLYGRTKAAGELIGLPFATTVRTSFIGPDHGVLWAYLQAASEGRPTFPGWRRAMWTGSTVWAVARGLVDVMMEPPAGQVAHLSTAEAISKADLLESVKRALGLSTGVLPVDAPAINRILEPTVVLAPVRHGLRELAERCGYPAPAGSETENR